MAVAHDFVSVLLVAAASESATAYAQLLAEPPAGDLQIATAASITDGLARCREVPPDCLVVVDPAFGPASLDLLAALADEEGTTVVPVVVLVDDEQRALAAIDAGAQDSLARPDITRRALRRAIVSAAARQRRQARQRGTRDLTKRQQYERLLASYQLMANHANDVFLFMRGDGQLVGANHAASVTYGYDQATLLTLNIRDLRGPLTVYEVSEQMARADQGGLLFETIHRRRDGLLFPVEVSSVGAELDGERLLLSVIRDITARKVGEAERARLYSEEHQARLQAAEAEAWFRALFEGLADGVVITDAAGRLLDVNQATVELLGYSRAELLGRAVADLLTSPPERFAAEFARLGAQGHWRGKTRWRRRDGDAVAVESVVTAARVGDRAVYISIQRDMAERQRAERTRRLLAASSALVGSAQAVDQVAAVGMRLAVPSLADYCTVFLVEADRSQRLALAHVDAAREARLCALWDASPAVGALPRSVRAVMREGRTLLLPEYALPPSTEWGEDAALHEFVEQVGARSVIAVPLCARGDVSGIMLFATASDRPRYDEGDLALAELLAGRVALALDHARLYEAEQAARHAAEAAVRGRDEFLSIAAHELLTPVTGLKGNVQALLRAQARGEVDPARVARVFARLDEACNRLSLLTHDLLDVARLRTGHMPVRPVPLDLPALVSEVALAYREHLGPSHRLTVRGEPLPRPVRVDRARIEQVLHNLLSNAVKYSPEGGTIEVRVAPTADGAEVTVADEGIGLPMGSTEVIFEPFGRAANAERQALPGMGLGLYICRQIVAQHGGRLWAESPGEGWGATFHLWLPLA